MFSLHQVSVTNKIREDNAAKFVRQKQVGESLAVDETQHGLSNHKEHWGKRLPEEEELCIQLLFWVVLGRGLSKWLGLI